MSELIIHGGGPFRETAKTISGYKHLAVLAAAYALGRVRRTRIGNVPNVRDLRLLTELIETAGATAELAGDTLWINPAGLRSGEMQTGLSRQFRGSLYLLPVLLARCGTVRFGGSGGCLIHRDAGEWSRPYRYAIEILEKFGARARSLDDGTTELVATRLRPAEVDIRDFSTDRTRLAGGQVLSATKIALLAAALAEGGTTLIRNPVMMPISTIKLVEIMRADGVELEIRPGEIRVQSGGAGRLDSVDIAPDATEAMTYIAFANICGVPVRLDGMSEAEATELMPGDFEALHAMGVSLAWSERSLRVEPTETLHPTDIFCASGHGVITDNQPFFALMLLKATGRSRIADDVWPERFEYARELAKLGASIEHGQGMITLSPSRLQPTGAQLVGGDVRRAALCVLAALSVNGRTVVSETGHLLRGYKGFFDHLQRCGASMEYVET